MKARNVKKLLALALAASMAIPSVPANAEGNPKAQAEVQQSEAAGQAEVQQSEAAGQAEVQQSEAAGQAEVQQSEAARAEIPQPYYEFTFDGEVKDNKVENEGSKTGVSATIEGNRPGLGVQRDEERSSNVLNLPGGTTNGAKEGRLTLPNDMFAEVTDAGFAFSFWINIDPSAAQYSRIFSATVQGQNSDQGGSWTAPEFSFVAGQEGASDLGADSPNGYHTAIMLPDQASCLKLVWEKQFARGRWQHVTVSVSPKAYEVYLDGEPVKMLYDRNNNQAAILSRLFADNAAILKQYKYSGIGPSVYTTDKDLKAKMDEFRFYNVALTADQAKAAYDSYKVGDELLAGLQAKVDEAKGKSISFYSRDSFQALQSAIAKGEQGIANPVTAENVTRLTENLDNAIKGLVFYTGVTADTAFSNAQLRAEKEEAAQLVAQGSLSSASEQAIQAAISAADTALAGQDQEAVDAALTSLRKAVDEKTYGAALHFDADPAKSKGALFHGSTGFLYGVSEVGVPSADLIQAISPKILVQKAADGQQHPSGDGYRLTSYLETCGVENIQIYLQDFYLQWPYESNGIEDYNTKVQQIVSKMVAGKTAEQLEHYSFVIFNEPDQIWYGGRLNQMCTDWLKIYRTIKGINPSLKVAGPNFAGYNSNSVRTFLEYCKNNHCLPEYITWHELQKDKLASFKSHCDEVKQFVKTYYTGSGIEPVLFVNETVNFDDVGNPGALVNWLSIFDEEDTYASLPYWGLANSMNELAADNNKPNGAWWVYRWYAQMTGNKMPLTLENIEGPGAYGRLYGLTSADDSAKTIYSLFGGQAGKQTVSIENIRSTKTFQNASNAHVKIYRTKFTGHHGFADETPVVFEGNMAFTGNDLVFTMPDAELMDAYFAVISPATGTDNSAIGQYAKNWQQTYEAENATLIGSAEAYTKNGGGDLARSNRAEVGHLNSASDGVKFQVEVPKDGRYRLNIYYSSQAPQVDPLTLQYVESGGQNRAVGALCTHSLSIDGANQQDIVYDSTVKWGYYNYKTVYVNLTAGKHEIQLMYKGEDQNGKNVNSMLCALLDKIDLVYAPQAEAVVEIEPEELAPSQAGFALSQEGSCSGAGAAVGSGDFEFYVNAPRDGYYAVGTAGAGTAKLSKSKVDYAQDAQAESTVSTSWLELLTVNLGQENAGSVYLTAGINRLRLSGSNLTLDKIVFTEKPEVTAANATVLEAEDQALSGTPSNDSYNYLPGSKAVPEVIETAHASGGKAVEGFRGGKDNRLSLTVNAPEAGAYKLSVFYSNDEPAPVMKKQDGGNYVHPYNTDLVERYMQIAVNGKTPQTVYFRNTFCWDTYKNTIVDIELEKGANTITFTNDNSYKFSAVQDDFTPRMDKFVVAKAAVAGSSQPAKIDAAAPKITKQPSNASFTYGKKASALTVAASVTDGGSLSYQWYKNTRNTAKGAKPISGATKNSYTPATSAAGTLYYYCVVTNTNQATTGSKTASTSSRLASIKVNKAANKITGVSSGNKAYGDKPFTLKAKAQGTITYTSSDKKVAVVGKTNGKVTIKGCGIATITIKAAGNSKYNSAAKKVTITVKPKKQVISGLSSKKKTFTVKWKKDSKATGYKIQYATNQKFKKAASLTIKKNSTTTQTVRKAMKAGKKYYVRVCAFKTYKKKTIQGTWSKAKSIKIKK